MPGAAYAGGMSRATTRTSPEPSATRPAAPRPTVPTAAVAAGSLVAGFAVAQATDVRALGGAVLVAGAVGCGRHWVRRGGPVVASGLLLGYAGAFVGSHLLAREIGAWPAVLSVSAAVGVAAWVASDRRG